MGISVSDKYSLELFINNKKVDFSRTVFENLTIIEGIWQSLPSVQLILINDGELVEVNPLIDGAQIDFTLTLFTQGEEAEEIKMETLLWSHSIEPDSDGYRITLNCLLSAPDFIGSRIEAIEGSSFDVFNTLATRSRMQLISDPSIDKQVWIRPGIRGNIWLNDVINRSWASPDSAFIYGVTRNRELLRYNLSERAARNPTWFFSPNREVQEKIPDNTILYSYPRFNSQSGLLNSVFGYGRNLSSFNLETGVTDVNKPKSFTKRTNVMNVNSKLEVPQKYDTLGFNNSLNVHENYFNAYAQNMRLKSFYSSTVDLMTEIIRPIRLLDRITLQLYNEASQETQDVYAGDYFIKNISTIVDPNLVTRRITLVREGINSDPRLSGSSK